MQELTIDLSDAERRRVEQAAAASGMTVEDMARAELERRYLLQHAEGVVVPIAKGRRKGDARGHD